MFQLRNHSTTNVKSISQPNEDNPMTHPQVVSHTPSNQPQEVTPMLNIDALQLNLSSNIDGAKCLSSIALWNGQFRRAEQMVERGLRFHTIKPLGMVIIGEAGAGKTHFAKKKRDELNAFSVKKDDYYTMPVVMVSAPKQSTITSIVHRLLFEIGDIKPNTGTMEDKEHRLKMLLKILEVKLIIVDEIHDFLPKTQNGKGSTALSWLKGLMDDTLIPILFMGTERANLLNVIDKELASRIRYSVTISRLSYGPIDEQRFDFAEMSTAFAKNLPKQLKDFNFVTFINDVAVYSKANLLDRLYVATNGLPRGLRDIFLEINIEMEDNPNFSPNLGALSLIYDRLLSMNDYIDFNPFDVGKLDEVRNYIGYTTKGLTDEAA